MEWGNPQKIKQKNLYTQIVGETTSWLYLLRCKDNEFTNDIILEKYRTNLTLEQSIALPLSVNGTVERVLLVNNILTIFISARNTLTGKVDLFVQKMDENFKIMGSPFIICSIEKGKFIEKRKIQIKTNADRSKIGILYLTWGEDANTSHLNLYCFNNQIQQIYGKQFKLNYPQKSVFMTSYDLSNLGDAFVLIDFPKEPGKDDSGDPRKFFLFGYYQNNDRIMEYQLDKDSLFTEELGMVLNNFNQTVSVVGFYSTKNRNEVSGYFVERINLNTQLAELNYAGLMDPNVLQKLNAAKLDKKRPDLNDFYIRKVIARSDGGLMLVIEKYYQTRQTYTYYVNNFPQTATRIIYNYDEVGIISLNKEGQIQFSDLIKKRQNSVGDGGYLSSIITIPTTDFVYTVFNSDLDKESDIMLHYTNYLGKSDGKILIKSSNFEATIIPTEYKQTSANSVILSTIRDKQFTLMRVTF